MASYKDVDDLVRKVENKGLRWDVGMIGPETYEARIWRWPHVIGRARRHEIADIFNLLLDALIDANED